ncbi:glycosyltransferase family 2 protein [Paludibacterium yongneupense]|uniref:glycosyltransferase family 2 protein n=1 Tax=Paludibacterium yongneupense TaxID=400061 RepID=UPI00040D1215|nr:glycosyltransferase family 2 protein [Paludibacterium yongneupense]
MPFTVSIIIAHYNAKPFIDEAIASVQAQTYRDWELIIVDDCSNDGSYEYLQERAVGDAGLRLLRTGHNSGGPELPRFIGVAHARGRYVAFLDADDYWEPGKLMAQMECIKRDGYNFVCTGRYDVDTCGAKSPGPVQRGPLSLRTLLRRNIITTSSVLLDRTLLEGLSPANDTMLRYEDYYLWLCVFSKPDCRGRLLPGNWVDYRVLPDSRSRGNYVANLFSEAYVVCKFIESSGRLDLIPTLIFRLLWLKLKAWSRRFL